MADILKSGASKVNSCDFHFQIIWLELLLVDCVSKSDGFLMDLGGFWGLGKQIQVGEAARSTVLSQVMALISGVLTLATQQAAPSHTIRAEEWSHRTR